jgi:uncharacterized protein (UPF0332 family)
MVESVPYLTMRALLYTKGLEPKTHEGLLRLIGMHFVKAGILTAQDSHLLTRLQKYRSEADDNAAYSFTHADFQELRLGAVQLDAKIRRELEKYGLRE